MQNFIKIGQMVVEIWWFNGFQNDDHLPLGFLKFKLFLCQDGYETHFASVCQILLRSVKLLLIYHDFVIFKMDFQKFQILTVCPLYGASMRHHAKFRQNGDTVAEMWRFNHFQNGGLLPSWIFEIQVFNDLGG